MKISKLWQDIGDKYPNKLRIIKKGIFWIMINEEAYFMSNFFNLKITKLDKENIKIGFPDNSIKSWICKIENHKLGYIMIEKVKEVYKITKINEGLYYNNLIKVNIEDYELTKTRILGLSQLGLEMKVTKNFLLKDKLEENYILLSHRLLKMPRKERYYFRNKIESIYMDMMEYVYKYMYNLGNRKELIEDIFEKVLIIREFTRFLFNLGKIKNDNVFLDMGDRWVEIMKICKGIKNKVS